MNSTTKLVTAGVAGAAIASAVLITVYEGHVVAETRSTRTELAAGGSTTLHPDGAPVIASRAALPAAFDPAHATRDELVAYTRQQEAQLASLRNQVAALEHGAAKDDGDPDHPWYKPSPEQLAAWVSECRVRSDQPSLEQFEPVDDPRHVRGLRASEVADYNATLTEMASGWRSLVRRLYIEVTGDAAGAETLSVEAMRKEIDDKSPPAEHNNVLQKLAQERAGLASPPADVAKTSPIEQLTRAYVSLGDQTEAGLAKRLGPERAHALRGNAWASRNEQSGCP